MKSRLPLVLCVASLVLAASLWCVIRRQKQKLSELNAPTVSEPFLLSGPSGGCAVFTVLPAEKQAYFLSILYFEKKHYPDYRLEMWLLRRDRKPLKKVWTEDLKISPDETFDFHVRREFLLIGQYYYVQVYGLETGKTPVEIEKYGFEVLPEDAFSPDKKPCV